ncbi:MAG: hypothetical protein ACJ8FY_21685 [Gemmataceae bacterium]
MAKARTLRAILGVEVLENREMLSTAAPAIFQRTLARGLPAGLLPVSQSAQPDTVFVTNTPSALPATIITTASDAASISGQRPGRTLPPAKPVAPPISAPTPVVTPHPAPHSTGVTIPHHYRHIRIAELAYGGVPLGSFERTLLQNSVDLVIPHTGFLDGIQQIAPNTPAIVYSNVSSLYFDLMNDWLRYADAHRLNREAAFYYVSQATSFSGSSASSQPVTWFWGVYSAAPNGGLMDSTMAAHSSNTVAFRNQGTSVYVGSPDKFREINFTLSRGASQGWRGVLEYATAVDSKGNPTGWTTLRALSDTTNGLRNSGQILFDPPAANWKTSSLNGTDPLFYVRIRTVANGSAPVAQLILGRDYVGANGHDSGTVPAFDYTADANHDGYLNNTEYAHRHADMDARFVYESRALSGYGQERPPTNPANLDFRKWAIDYTQRLLKAHPLADGVFMDNSAGKLPLDGTGLLESTAAYSSAYGSLLHAISQKIAPGLLVANTAGGQSDADPVVAQTVAYYEEFAIRALAHNYQQFEDLAQQVAHRAALQGPKGYAILDSLPQGGSPTDPRTQIATLAYYYMIGDPNRTFLNFFGGFEPSTSWTRHWSQAAAYDVGLPRGTWSLFATGSDPSDVDMTYRVYQRSYTNALVLYKPLSFASSATSPASLGTDSATVHNLGGTYRPLHADGTLGAPITRISLRNGEGAILIKV